MTRLYALESFDDLAGQPADSTVSAAALEEARLASYETGYAEGWDDAVGAQEDEITRLRADLGQNLRAMALTYAEARTHVLRALEPLLAEMISKVLPHMARAALGEIVLQTLRPLASEMADAPLVVRAHPANRAAVERIAEAPAGLPLSFEGEPSLPLGQVYLSAGNREAKIDLDAAIEQIATAVTSYFHPDCPQENGHD